MADTTYEWIDGVLTAVDPEAAACPTDPMELLQCESCQ